VRAKEGYINKIWNNKKEGKIPIRSTYSNSVPFQVEGDILIPIVQPILHILKEKQGLPRLFVTQLPSPFFQVHM